MPPMKDTREYRGTQGEGREMSPWVTPAPGLGAPPIARTQAPECAEDKAMTRHWEHLLRKAREVFPRK